MHEVRQSPEPNVRIVLIETISVFSVWLVSTADTGSASVSGAECHTVIVMRRRPLALWLSREARAFAYLESATLFLEPLVSGRNLVRSPSAERRVRSLLAMEAFNSQNTQDKSVSRRRKATYHPHGVAGEVAGKIVSHQLAFRQLWKK